METYFERIEKQEAKDREIASNCLTYLLRRGTNLEINPTAITDYVDLRCKVTNPEKNKVIPFNVEIKERTKNEDQLRKYPTAELKVDKLARMRSMTPKGTNLFYMVLLNQKWCLLFDLNRLDWSKVERRAWWQKRTQYNPNSDYVSIETYFIPYTLATIKYDCSEWFEEYNKKLAALENANN